MKDGTLWLDTLKKKVEKKSTETHKRVARAYATSANAFSETLAQDTDKTDRGLDRRGGLLARGALLGLFEKDQEWRCFFKSCCEMSTHRLTTQTWQFRDELEDRGHFYPVEEVEDALLGLARDLLPESAAAGWDTDGHTPCARMPLPAWRSATPGSPPRRKTPSTSLVKTYGTSG